MEGYCAPFQYNSRLLLFVIRVKSFTTNATKFNLKYKVSFYEISIPKFHVAYIYDLSCSNILNLFFGFDVHHLLKK